MNEVLLLFVIFLALALLKVPLIFSMIIAASVIFAITDVGIFQSPVFLARLTFNALDMFALTAVSLFLMVGELTQHKIAEDIVSVIQVFLGWMKGTLSFVTVVACLFFGAIVGAIMPTIAGIGGIMIPIMEKAGFMREKATALVTASGIVGILIPPSITSILISLVSGIPVSVVFLTSVGPAFVFGIGFFVISYFLNDRHIPPTPISSIIPKGQNKLPFMLKTLINALPALLLPVIILGGIYGGVFTPTEASAVSVLYILIYYFLSRKFNMPKLIKETVLPVGLTTGIVLLLYAFSGPLSRIISVYKVTTAISSTILSITQDPIVILLLVNLVIIILGMFLEAAAIIIIAVPVFLPLMVAIGIHPWHFAGFFEANIAVGALTPPVGYGIFMGSRVGKIEIHVLAKHLLPYLAWCIITLIILVLFPGISTWLPSVIVGGY